MRNKTKPTFQQLFIRKEYKIIAGANKKHSIFLIVIISFSLLSLVMSWQYYSNLKMQMSDPYVNYLALTVNDRISNDFSEIIDLAQNEPFKSKYALKDIYQFHKVWFDFQNPQEPEKFKWMIGLAMEKDQPLLSEIIKQNCSETTADIGCKIIVTDKFQKQLGSEVNRFLTSTSITDFKNNRLFPIEIYCAAERLPFKSDFIVDRGLGASIEQNGTYDSKVQGTHFELLFQYFDGKVDLTENTIYEIFSPEDWEVLEINQVLANNQYAAFTAHLLRRSGKTLSYNEFGELLDSIRLVIKPEFSILLNPIDDFYNPDLDFERLPDQLAFQFEKLDHLDAFVNYMENTFNARFDMESIQTRNRMLQISKLALAAISALIILAGIIVLVYLGQLIIRHVEKSFHTFGMIKAFGLGALELRRLYDLIIIKMLGIAISWSLVPIMMLWLLDIIKMDATLGLIILLFSLIIFTMGLMANRIFLRGLISSTPSDLINGRI